MKVVYFGSFTKGHLQIEKWKLWIGALESNCCALKIRFIWPLNWYSTVRGVETDICMWSWLLWHFDCHWTHHTCQPISTSHWPLALSDLWISETSATASGLPQMKDLAVDMGQICKLMKHPHFSVNPCSNVFCPTNCSLFEGISGELLFYVILKAMFVWIKQLYLKDNSYVDILIAKCLTAHRLCFPQYPVLISDSHGQVNLYTHVHKHTAMPTHTAN